jgi:hypothetical protein
MPEWRTRLPEVSALNAGWAALVPQWDELEALYRDGEVKECSRRIWELAERAHAAVRPGRPCDEEAGDQP